MHGTSYHVNQAAQNLRRHVAAQEATTTPAPPDCHDGYQLHVAKGQVADDKLLKAQRVAVDLGQKRGLPWLGMLLMTMLQAVVDLFGRVVPDPLPASHSEQVARGARAFMVIVVRYLQGLAQIYHFCWEEVLASALPVEMRSRLRQQPCLPRWRQRQLLERGLMRRWAAKLGLADSTFARCAVMVIFNQYCMQSFFTAAL